MLCSWRGTTLHYKDKDLCELGFNTHNIGEGDSLGMVLTLKKEVHWFVNGVWRRSVHVKDYPLDQPMWGVIDMFGPCKQVKAEICSGNTILVHCMCSHIITYTPPQCPLLTQ